MMLFRENTGNKTSEWCYYYGKYWWQNFIWFYLGKIPVTKFPLMLFMENTGGKTSHDIFLKFWLQKLIKNYCLKWISFFMIC